MRYNKANCKNIVKNDRENVEIFYLLSVIVTELKNIPISACLKQLWNQKLVVDMKRILLKRYFFITCLFIKNKYKTRGVKENNKG